jgi:preprotein translocase subunit SecG
MNILINVILAIDMLVAVLMTLVILMQRPKSEGLGAAFGGGVTENIFGAQTTNVLTKFTGWLAGIFFVLTFVLGILYARRSASDSSLHRELMGMPAAATRCCCLPFRGPERVSAAIALIKHRQFTRLLGTGITSLGYTARTTAVVAGIGSARINKSKAAGAAALHKLAHARSAPKSREASWSAPALWRFQMRCKLLYSPENPK